MPVELQVQHHREYMAQPEGTKAFSLLQQPKCKSHRKHVTKGAAQQTAGEALQGSAIAAATSSTCQYLQAVSYSPYDTGPEVKELKAL